MRGRWPKKLPRKLPKGRPPRGTIRVEIIVADESLDVAAWVRQYAEAVLEISAEDAGQQSA